VTAYANTSTRNSVLDNAMRIFPLGENALTVEFGDTISHELNDAAISLSTALEAEPFPGFVECVPAYSSTTVYYDLRSVRMSFPESMAAIDAVTRIVETHISESKTVSAAKHREVEIPVSFSNENALDRESVSQMLGLSADEIVEIFLTQTYRVYMLGFLPGFPYMGEVDERIAMPRRDSPRLTVPKGSVGIAGRQTGIYPLESPGGWQIIGCTEIDMFDPSKSRPCFLSPGDEVKFVQI